LNCQFEGRRYFTYLLGFENSIVTFAPQNFHMATTSDMRTGLILKVDGSLYTVIEFGQNKTARAAAKVWAKLKGVDNNRTIELTWNSGETIFPVRVEKKPYQYLYKDDTGYSFMDTETYEQITVPANMVDAPQFLKTARKYLY
jgi:elongation factor P